jgi:CRISPR-associated protein Cas2
VSKEIEQRWLIGYDITCPRRLGSVYRYLSKQGVALQYSLFSVTGTSRSIEKIFSGIAARIDSAEDDIRAYHLTMHTKIWALGTHCNESDVTLTDETLLSVLGANSVDVAVLKHVVT